MVQKDFGAMLKRLLRYHGIKELFPYLKELEFRYNNRGNVFDKIIEVIRSG